MSVSVPETSLLTFKEASFARVAAQLAILVGNCLQTHSVDVMSKIDLISSPEYGLYPIGQDRQLQKIIPMTPEGAPTFLFRQRPNHSSIECSSSTSYFYHLEKQQKREHLEQDENGQLIRVVESGDPASMSIEGNEAVAVSRHKASTHTVLSLAKRTVRSANPKPTLLDEDRPPEISPFLYSGSEFAPSQMVMTNILGQLSILGGKAIIENPNNAAIGFKLVLDCGVHRLYNIVPGYGKPSNVVDIWGRNNKTGVEAHFTCEALPLSDTEIAIAKTGMDITYWKDSPRRVESDRLYQYGPELHQSHFVKIGQKKVARLSKDQEVSLGAVVGLAQRALAVVNSKVTS